MPTANREKATVKVRIGLKRKDPRILPDMAVKVTFLERGCRRARQPRPRTERARSNRKNNAQEKTLAPDIPMVRLAGLTKSFVKGKETISIFDQLDSPFRAATSSP